MQDPTQLEILVVDDVQTMRIHISMILKETGFQRITLAQDGEEAWNLLQKKPFQLVLCDWHMLPTDGFNLLRRVRSSEKLKNLAFIMITAENAIDNIKAVLASGVDDYVVKPASSKQLNEKIMKIILRKNLA